MARTDQGGNAATPGNADASLKDSRITVQPIENNAILLTGASMTKAQSKHASEIAAAQAGEGNVINAIRDSDATAG